MFLGLDLGTTNVKVLLVEKNGGIVARASAPVQLFHVEDGGVEQDIEDIFAAVLTAIGRIAAAADVSSVQALGVSSQGGALQILDGDGRPLGRVISWLDARGKPYDEAITRDMGTRELARHSGHPQGTMALGQLLRLREHQPELPAKPNRIGFVGDVIVSRLCGRWAHDATSLSCAVLFNPSTGLADPEMLERAGISEDQLPELISPREPAGGLLNEVAAKTSLAAGIPVSAPVHDQYASALGVGATAPGDVMFGSGTAWALLAVSDRPMLPASDIGFVCRHVVEGLYGQILSMVNGGCTVTWALDLLGLSDKSGAEIDDLLDEIAPGADGLRVWPLLAPKGGAVLAAGTAGRLTGLRLGHGRTHVLRAVVEGLAMELARYLGFFADAGAAMERLVMCGGAAASRVTPQIIADTTGLPVACATESETGALGAAMLARGLLEPKRSLTEISAAMTPPLRVVEPGPDAALYQEMFAQYVAELPLDVVKKEQP